MSNSNWVHRNFDIVNWAYENQIYLCLWRHDDGIHETIHFISIVSGISEDALDKEGDQSEPLQAD